MYLTDDLFLHFSNSIVLHQGASLHVSIGMVEDLSPLLVDEGGRQSGVERPGIVLPQDGQHVPILRLLSASTAHLMLELIGLSLLQLAGLVPQGLPYDVLGGRIDGLRHHLVLQPGVKESLFVIFCSVFLCSQVLLDSTRPSRVARPRGREAAEGFKGYFWLSFTDRDEVRRTRAGK